MLRRLTGNLAHTHRFPVTDLLDDVDFGDGHRAAQSAGHSAFFDFIDPAEHIDQKGIELLCVSMFALSLR